MFVPSDSKKVHLPFGIVVIQLSYITIILQDPIKFATNSKFVLKFSEVKFTYLLNGKLILKLKQSLGI